MNSMFDIWSDALKRLTEKISPLSYENWVKDLRPIRAEGDSFVLMAGDDVACSTLRELYGAIVSETLYTCSGIKYNVEFMSRTEVERKFGLNEPHNEATCVCAPSLNSKYTFDTFVVGESNRFAHAACIAVANKPAGAYNPLFMYGGVGLGKTHLMHAIGNVAYANNPNIKIMYVTCEDFTNEVIQAIRDGKEGKNAEFRRKYRDIDILMVDDVQFLAGKTSTQSEFFHTFNTLYTSNKQIILTSDRPAHEIPTLEARLYSRFECGLVTDINQPDFETRAAILKKRAENEHIEISDEVLFYIAKRVQSNIRELEGALNRVVAHSQLAGSKIDVSLVDSVLADILQRSSSHRLTSEIIIQAVSDYYQIPVDDIIGKKRDKKIVVARQMSMYLCRQLTTLSFVEIGEVFGGKHYSTVMHACETVAVDSQDKASSTVRINIDDIKSRLQYS